MQDKQNVLEDKITKLEDEILQQNSLSKRVKDLEAKLTTNTDQIPQSKQNTYASKVTESNAPPLLPTEAPKQISVTSDRKFNIVVFGVEEPPSEMSRIDRQKHNLGKILNTISSIDSSFTAASFKDFHRLGKFRQNASKPQPVLVKFLRMFDATLVLSSRASIKSSQISIKPDLTNQR